MTKLITIENIASYEGERVKLQGWLYASTRKGKLLFVRLRDGTGMAQCVLFKKNVPEDLFESVGGAGQESSITLTGEVLPVGGIKEKVLAAHRSGIRKVILPERNRKDLPDIPPSVREDMTFHFATRMDEALNFALEPTNTPGVSAEVGMA